MLRVQLEQDAALSKATPGHHDVASNMNPGVFSDRQRGRLHAVTVMQTLPSRGVRESKWFGNAPRPRHGALSRFALIALALSVSEPSAPSYETESVSQTADDGDRRRTEPRTWAAGESPRVLFHDVSRVQDACRM